MKIVSGNDTEQPLDIVKITKSSKNRIKRYK